MDVYTPHTSDPDEDQDISVKLGVEGGRLAAQRPTRKPASKSFAIAWEITAPLFSAVIGCLGSPTLEREFSLAFLKDEPQNKKNK